jgi:hypothetical protein
MHHNVNYTYVRMYISDKKNYLKVSNNILNSACEASTPRQAGRASTCPQITIMDLVHHALQANPREGQTGDSDLRLHHIPEEF